LAELYGAQLRSSVRERLQGPALAHLSGGMDSTAVALLGGEMVRSGQVAGPLHSLSLVYDRLPKLARERPFLESVLGRVTGLEVHRLAADDLLDFDAFADAPPHDEPYPGLWRLQMDRATVDCTRAVGAGTMLTGIGADEVLDVQPFHLADLLRRGRLLKAWREAGRWARALNSSKWTILCTFGVGALGWGCLSAWMGRRLGSLDEQGDSGVPPWIRPEFARDVGLQQRARAVRRQVFRRCSPTALSLALHSLESEAGDPVRWSVAAPQGIAVAHPFLDPRLLTLGLSIRTRLRPEPGRMKPLLADALRGVLPPEILGRRGKGHFDEVYYLGLARNLGRLEKLVRTAPVDHLGLFDKEALARQLEEASLAGANARKLFPLDLSLCLLQWLARHEEWHRAPAPPREVIAWGGVRPAGEVPGERGGCRLQESVR
jgi:asparagine synthase (glutamine-hydrolysing)